MAKITNNVKGTLGCAIFTLIMLLGALRLSFGSLTSPGPGFMPVCVAIVMLAGCFICMLEEILRPSATPAPKEDLQTEDSHQGVNTRRPLKIMITMIAYPFVLVNLGFIISTFLLVFVNLRLMEYRNRLASVIAALLIMVIVMFTFNVCFKIGLPTGIWG